MQCEKAGVEYDPETSLPSRRESVVVARTLVSAAMIAVVRWVEFCSSFVIGE